MSGTRYAADTFWVLIRYSQYFIRHTPSPTHAQTNPCQPTPPRSRFKISPVSFVDNHAARVGSAAEVVATQECAPSSFAPLLLHADACA